MRGVVWAMSLGLFWTFSALAQPPAERVRPAAVAGSWYPGEAAELATAVDGHLAGTAEPLAEPVRALIVPHAGYRYSGAAAGDGFRAVRGQAVRRVIVLGPAHRGGFRGLAVADVTHYETPLGRIPVDREARERLRASPLFAAEDESYRQEHSIEIQLPLLQRALAPGWVLLPVLVGRLEPADYPAAAELLRPLADAAALVVVSTDFTHYGPGYGYLPFPPGAELPERLQRLDLGAYERVAARDPEGFLAYREQTGATICGYGGLAILAHLAPADTSIHLLRYTSSGAVTGDYRQSVGYLAAAVTGPRPFAGTAEPPAPPPGGALDGAQLERLARLARAAVDAAVAPDATRQQTLAEELDGLPESLQRPAGAFVTLRKAGELRGCVGIIEPQRPLNVAVMDSAGNAALRDRRFTPVNAAELPALDVEVSVLSPPRPIASPEEFTVGEHGIILERDGRRAVYLPEVAPQQGWSREQTLTHLALKAGLPPDAWREGARLSVFTTQSRHLPAPAGPARATHASTGPGGEAAVRPPGP